MVFRGAKAAEFELSILRYEYPDSQGEGQSVDYDANWLVVRVRLGAPACGWSMTRPCVLTWEVERLIAWLRAVADKTNAVPEFSFTEPYLAFELLMREPRTVVLRVRCEVFGAIRGRTEMMLWADVRLTPAVLRTAAQSLQAELDAYPPRGAVRPRWRVTS